MSCVVRVKDAQAGDSFQVILDNTGISYKRYPNMPKTFLIFDCDKNDFPLSDHEAVKAVFSGDVEFTPQASTQAQTINNTFPCNYISTGRQATGPGSWPLVRMCRRRNPFGAIPTGVDTDYNYVYTRTGKGVDIYIMDHTTNPNHSEYAGRCFNVRDDSTTFYLDPQFNNGNNLTNLGTSHGAMVASCAGGTNVGVAKDATLWVASVYQMDGFALDSPLNLNFDTMLDCFDQVIGHFQSRAHLNRPAVANLSFSSVGDGADTLYGTAAQDMIDAGIVFTVPTGNKMEDMDLDFYAPVENDPDIVAVAGTDMFDRPYRQTDGGTNYGTVVDIFAPAQNFPVAVNMGGFYYGSGTSFAGPYVAGVIACMLEGHDRLTSRTQVRAVKEKLLQNATRGAIEFPKTYTVKEGSVPNLLLYLDPFIEFEEIPRL